IDSLHASLTSADEEREIALFPQGFTRALARGLSRFARTTRTKSAALRPKSLLSPRRWLGGMARLGRQVGERIMRRQFHHLAKQCQLYHEPNYIPFDSDLPTVITVHDLSVLLHPEWHPAERVRNF